MNPDILQQKIDQTTKAINFQTESTEDIKVKIETISREMQEYKKETLEAGGQNISDELAAKFDTMAQLAHTKYGLELTNLYDQIVENNKDTLASQHAVATASPATPTATEEVSGSVVEEEEKEKNIFQKYRGGVKSDREEKNYGKLALKTAGTGLALYAGYKAVKRIGGLFGFGKKEKKEEKGFRDKGLGKTLQYAAAGVGGFLGIKWLLKYLGTGKVEDEGAEANKKPEEILNEYNELSPEQKESFGKLGIAVNDFYVNIFAAEHQSGREDDHKLGTIAQQVELKTGVTTTQAEGVVPFAINNTFGSVDKLLSEEGTTYMMYVNDAVMVKEKILDRADTAVMDSLIAPMLGSLQSFVPFASVAGSWKEKIINRFDTDPQARADELATFFRQYARIFTFYNDKKDQLQTQIAQQAFQSYPGEFDSIQDAIEDPEWFQKHILENDDYTNFMAKSPYSAIQWLDTKGLLHGYIDQSTSGLQSEIATLDEVREDIVGSDDVLGKLSAGQLGIESSRDELTDICEALNEDINDGREMSFLYGVFGSVHVAINTNKAALEDILEETGINKLKEVYKDKIQLVQQKIEAGTAQPLDIQHLRQVANNYFAFKKEASIAAHSLQEIRDENFDGVSRAARIMHALGKDIVNRGGTARENLQKGNRITAYLMGIPIAYAGSTAVGFKFPKIAKLMRRTYMIPYTGAKIAGGYVIRQGFKRGLRKGAQYSGNIYLMRKALYPTSDPHALSRLLHDTLTGRLSPDIANKLLQEQNMFGNTSSSRVQTRANGESYNSIYGLLDKREGLSRTDAEALLGKKSGITWSSDGLLSQKLYTNKKVGPKRWSRTLFGERGGFSFEITGESKEYLKHIQKIEDTAAIMSDASKAKLVKLMQKISGDADALIYYQKIGDLAENNKLSGLLRSLDEAAIKSPIDDILEQSAKLITHPHHHKLTTALDSKIARIDLQAKKTSGAAKTYYTAILESLTKFKTSNTLTQLTPKQTQAMQTLVDTLSPQGRTDLLKVTGNDTAKPFKYMDEFVDILQQGAGDTALIKKNIAAMAKKYGYTLPSGSTLTKELISTPSNTLMKQGKYTDELLDGLRALAKIF